MIWRDANEKPRVSGVYYCLCQFLDGDIGFSHRVFCVTRNEWQSEIKMIAWLDPEIPEKYLPKLVKDVEKPKGEWVDIRGFNFNPNKFYWAKYIYGGKEPWPDDGPWVLNGSGYRRAKGTYWPTIMIWSTPIDEPPR